LIALMSLGLLAILVSGVLAVVLLTGSDPGPSSEDAVAAIDAVVADADFDDDGIARLDTCPIRRTEQLIDDVIDRLDDTRLDTISRGTPGISHDALVVDFEGSGVQVVACERLGDDPNINVVGVSMSRAPDDVLAYLTELTGIVDIEIADEPDPDERTGPVVRWICTDTDDVTLRFCEVLWDDLELMATIYVGGASAARIDTDVLREVLLDSLDDWIEALAG
jgi:hypothetical protein